MNRLNEIVVFDPLSRDELIKFARLHMKDVAIHLAERGVALGVTDAALDLVLQEVYDPVINHFFLLYFLFRVCLARGRARYGLL